MIPLTINIPDDKIQLVRDAVTAYMRNEAGDDELVVTGAQAIAWMEGKLMDEAKRLVRNYQERVYRDNFTFNDPTGE